MLNRWGMLIRFGVGVMPPKGDVRQDAIRSSAKRRCGDVDPEYENEIDLSAASSSGAKQGNSFT